MTSPSTRRRSLESTQNMIREAMEGNSESNEELANQIANSVGFSSFHIYTSMLMKLF